MKLTEKEYVLLRAKALSMREQWSANNDLVKKGFLTEKSVLTQEGADALAEFEFGGEED